MDSDKFQCGGYQWRYYFLRSNSRITDFERRYLLFQTAEMHLAEEGTRRVVMDSLEGKISTTKKYEILGTFGGQHYDVELETNSGKVNLAFIIVIPREIEELR